MVKNVDGFSIQWTTECDEVISWFGIYTFAIVEITINNETFWQPVVVVWPLIRFLDFIWWKRTFQRNTLKFFDDCRKPSSFAMCKNALFVNPNGPFPGSEPYMHARLGATTEYFQHIKHLIFLVGRTRTSISPLYLYVELPC